MHRTASQGTAWEIPGACLSTIECWWTLQWFPWGRLFFSSNYRWRCSAERKTPFQSVFEKEQFNQPAQNWKGSSTGAIPAGNTLTPGQGKGGSCTDRRSGISSSDTALILLTPSQNRIRTCQAQHCPRTLKDSVWTALFLSRSCHCQVNFTAQNIWFHHLCSWRKAW